MKYLSIQETANALKVSRQRVDQLTRRKKNPLEFEWVGGVRIVSEESFSKFKRSRDEK